MSKKTKERAAREKTFSSDRLSRSRQNPLFLFELIKVIHTTDCIAYFLRLQNGTVSTVGVTIYTSLSFLFHCHSQSEEPNLNFHGGIRNCPHRRRLPARPRRRLLRQGASAIRSWPRFPDLVTAGGELFAGDEVLLQQREIVAVDFLQRGASPGDEF